MTARSKSRIANGGRAYILLRSRNRSDESAGEPLVWPAERNEP